MKVVQGETINLIVVIWSMKYDPNYSSTGPFTVRKWNRRLYIQADGVLVYSPPDFVRLTSRDSLQQLADDATAKHNLDIQLIASFELNSKRRKL